MCSSNQCFCDYFAGGGDVSRRSSVAGTDSNCRSSLSNCKVVKDGGKEEEMKKEAERQREERKEEREEKEKKKRRKTDGERKFPFVESKEIS